jgi:ATP-dependent DNA ligase
LTEATGYEAKTIHRLLEVDPKIGGFILCNGHLPEGGAVLFAHACSLGAEDILAKRIDAPYLLGKRARFKGIHSGHRCVTRFAVKSPVRSG